MRGLRCFIHMSLIGISTLFSAAVLSEPVIDDASLTDADMTRLYLRFGKLTESKANMSNLVAALQNGVPIVLKRRLRGAEHHSLVFDIPTQPMSYQDISATLEIADQALDAAGVRNPTIDQLQAVLMGGAVIERRGRLTNMQGILPLRSEGMEWDQVAYHLGISTTKDSVATGTESTTYAQKDKTQSRKRSRIVNLNGKGQSEVHTAVGGSPRTVADAYVAGESKGIVTANGDRAGYAGITTGSGSGYDGGSYAASAAVSGMVGANSGANLGAKVSK